MTFSTKPVVSAFSKKITKSENFNVGYLHDLIFKFFNVTFKKLYNLFCFRLTNRLNRIWAWTVTMIAFQNWHVGGGAKRERAKNHSKPGNEVKFDILSKCNIGYVISILEIWSQKLKIEGAISHHQNYNLFFGFYLGLITLKAIMNFVIQVETSLCPMLAMSQRL